MLLDLLLERPENESLQACIQEHQEVRAVAAPAFRTSPGKDRQKIYEDACGAILMLSFRFNVNLCILYTYNFQNRKKLSDILGARALPGWPRSGTATGRVGHTPKWNRVNLYRGIYHIEKKVNDVV